MYRCCDPLLGNKRHHIYQYRQQSWQKILFRGLGKTLRGGQPPLEVIPSTRWETGGGGYCALVLGIWKRGMHQTDAKFSSHTVVL